MEREPLLQPEASRTVRLEAEGADGTSDGGVPRPVRYERRGQGPEVRYQKSEVIAQPPSVRARTYGKPRKSALTL